MRLPFQACFVLLALAAGCVQVEETLTLNPDGSGVMEFSYGLSQQNVRRLADAVSTAQEMQQEDTTGAKPPETAPEPSPETPLNFDEASIRAEFKEFEPYGVTLESVRTESRDAWRFVHLKIGFKSLAGLSKTSMMSERAISLTHNADGNCVFSQSSGNGSSAQSVPEIETPEMRESVTNFMQGFRVVVNVKTPGRILDTNAHRRQDSTATWEYDIEKDPQAVERVGRLDLQVTFEGRGLNLPDFSYAGPPTM